MLRPIPARILRTTVTVKVCRGVDFYQNPSFDQYTVSHVHIQPTDRVIKTASNTDCQLTSILFADARRSLPALDWDELLLEAQESGGDVRVVIGGKDYTVASVDKLMDDTDHLHHWEVGLS